MQQWAGPYPGTDAHKPMAQTSPGGGPCPHLPFTPPAAQRLPALLASAGWSPPPCLGPKRTATNARRRHFPSQGLGGPGHPLASSDPRRSSGGREEASSPPGCPPQIRSRILSLPDGRQMCPAPPSQLTSLQSQLNLRSTQSWPCRKGVPSPPTHTPPGWLLSTPPPIPPLTGNENKRPKSSSSPDPGSEKVLSAEPGTGDPAPRDNQVPAPFQGQGLPPKPGASLAGDPGQPQPGANSCTPVGAWAPHAPSGSRGTAATPRITILEWRQQPGGRAAGRAARPLASLPLQGRWPR